MKQLCRTAICALLLATSAAYGQIDPPMVEVTIEPASNEVQLNASGYNYSNNGTLDCSGCGGVLQQGFTSTAGHIETIIETEEWTEFTTVGDDSDGDMGFVTHPAITREVYVPGVRKADNSSSIGNTRYNESAGFFVGVGSNATQDWSVSADVTTARHAGAVTSKVAPSGSMTTAGQTFADTSNVTHGYTGKDITADLSNAPSAFVNADGSPSQAFMNAVNSDPTFASLVTHPDHTVSFHGDPNFTSGDGRRGETISGYLSNPKITITLALDARPNGAANTHEDQHGSLSQEAYVRGYNGDRSSMLAEDMTNLTGTKIERPAGDIFGEAIAKVHGALMGKGQFSSADIKYQTAVKTYRAQGVGNVEDRVAIDIVAPDLINSLSYVQQSGCASANCNAQLATIGVYVTNRTTNITAQERQAATNAKQKVQNVGDKKVTQGADVTTQQKTSTKKSNSANSKGGNSKNNNSKGSGSGTGSKSSSSKNNNSSGSSKSSNSKSTSSGGNSKNSGSKSSSSSGNSKSGNSKSSTSGGNSKSGGSSGGSKSSSSGGSKSGGSSGGSKGGSSKGGR